MFSTQPNLKAVIGDFHHDRMMRYRVFVPRLYKLCKSLGFEAGKMMPSRAFCSDESQGFPIILISKHFGTFSFNHGRVGGIVATDRHGPHAEHGKDLVIIQASHVGYDSATHKFGTYRRLQAEAQECLDSCGKIGDVLGWYLDEYTFARENIFLGRRNGACTLTIDNQLLDEGRSEGLFLQLERLQQMDDGSPQPVQTFSTARSCLASSGLIEMLPVDSWPAEGRLAIGRYLVPELFSFKRTIIGDIEGRSHPGQNLLNPMPWKEHGYHGRRLVFVSCLNIDISPREGQIFPLTRCVPWGLSFRTKKAIIKRWSRRKLLFASMSRARTTRTRSTWKTPSLKWAGKRKSESPVEDCGGVVQQ